MPTTIKFTESQKRAIETEGKTLLVSAGAGSGKTSVLTERIIQRITDKNNPCDITDFLVVTFTKASANDLKSKIAKAINQNLAGDIDNTRLKRQQFILGRANISTIHSFYLELARNNFEKLGIPAKFRLADDNEISVIRRRVFENLLEEYYNSESEIYKDAEFSCQDCISAIENFIGSRDDAKIYDVILKIYMKINSLVNRFEIFEKQIQMMGEIESSDGGRGGFFGLTFGKILMQLLDEKIDACRNELGRLLEQTESDVTLSKKYTPAFSNKYEFFNRLKNFIERDCSYNEVYNLCRNYAKVKLGNHKLADDNLKNFFKERNDRISKKIEEITRYFEYDFDDIKRFAGHYKRIIAIIFDFIKRFEAAVRDEKARIKSFEFADLEHFAFELLIEKIDADGSVHETDLAKQLKERFKEIYIDEYQDTNKLQDIIFRAISTEQSPDYAMGNRFMVGDIKQSIYAFRGAKSDIFSFYSKLFRESAHGELPQKIYLKENFRSSSNIINFINQIFGELFTEKLGGVEYKGGEVLSYGKSPVDEAGDINDKKSADTTFAVIDKDINKIDGNEDNGGEDTVETESEPKESAEAEYIAYTVKNLISHGRLKNGEKITPRHITILMRGTTDSNIYMDALKKYGVPSYTDKAKGFLESAEIMLMVSLLKTIDNPHTDVPLAAVLKSPVFGFTLDDLIYLKNFHEFNETEEPAKKEYLYYYIKSFADKEDDTESDELREKCRSFLNRLRVWRLKSRTMTIDKFVWYLYRQTDIIAKTTGDNFSDERRGNLLLLHEYARQFEATSFNGLYGFLNYIDDVKYGKDDFEKSKISSENSDVVKIMSIHKSKGLEFPVCILAGTGKRFNVSDYTNDPIISEDCGIYFNLKCEDGIGFEKTNFKKVAADKIKAEMLSEEARILYVALTRAIEKLIVVGSVKNLEGFFTKYTADIDSINRDEFKRTMLFSEADCVLKWLTPIILNSSGKNKTDIDINIDIVDRRRFEEITASNIDAGEMESETGIETEAEVLTEREAAMVEAYANKIEAMYDYKYPQKFLSKIPVKLAVSNLHPGILDNDEYVKRTDELTLLPLPRFLEAPDNLGAGDSNNPALVGIAMHLFMQFADFETAEKFGAAVEAEKLLHRGFISDIQFSRLNFGRLNKFFSSDIYIKIKAAKNVYRETRFTVKVPASEFSESIEEIKESDEDMLIQGVIDLLFIDENGEITVVDFKTDSVRKEGGEEILIERHRQQLDYYCMAAAKIFDRHVKSACIYSFALGKEIEVSFFIQR